VESGGKGAVGKGEGREGGEARPEGREVGELAFLFSLFCLWLWRSSAVCGAVGVEGGVCLVCDGAWFGLVVGE
jgi:hypothetical protein